MVDFTKTDKFLWLEAAKERKIRTIGKNSDTGVSPAKENKPNWIDGYFSNLTCRVAGKQIIFSRSDIKEPSIDLQSSLKMFLQEAACDADNWTDVNCRYNDRRSFPALLSEISLSGLDKYASNNINIGYQPNSWSYIEPSPDDLDKFYNGSLKLMQLPQRIRKNSDRSIKWLRLSQTFAMVIADKYFCGSLSLKKHFLHDVADKHYGGSLSLEKLVDDVVIADKYYDGSLSLKELSQRIRSESAGDDFKREQARLLETFLDHLIKIQQEQRFVAYSFSEHLEQLRKFDDDGDRHKCPLILPEHAIDCYIWRQKHIFDSLCTMSRESVWLLKTLKDSYFSSPSSIKESNKILHMILSFTSKFKKSKDLLDQYLHDECFRTYVDPIRLVTYTNEKLEAFGGWIKDLQEQGVERKSVAETLLGCFLDVLNMSCKLENPSEDTCSSLKCSAKETSELIDETVDKLNSVRCSDLTSGGSPLGCMALWRILFESSLINLRLDLICKNHGETVKLGATDDQLEQFRLSIDKLLAVGESVLGEFIAMHKTVAEVTYMLGDAFTTGGAGMNDISDVTHLEDFNFDDFPWDKHNVPPRTENTMNWTDCVEDDG